MLEVGIRNTKTITCEKEQTALAMGSGTLEVFATPAMIALMEACAAQSVEELLEEGQTTVGTSLDIDHLSASPLGATIRCESVLEEIDNRKLTFSVSAFDNGGLIGKGIHSRFIVESERFFNKAQKKIEK